MRLSWETSSSPSSSSSDETDELAPTQLLSMAIKKRRSLYESKDRDYRKELLHTGMIQSLCKFLGEGRALRRRSNKRKRRSTNSQKSSSIPPSSLPKRYAVTNEMLENMNHTPTPAPVEKPEPTMSELNGGDGDPDDDAVVPVYKRPKYEQVFEPSEPTEQEKEIIREYVYEDFFSSLVSFYTPNEYYSSVEPTKDLYWCSFTDTDTTTYLDMNIPPDIEFLALCS
jgi:hypothetical protein